MLMYTRAQLTTLNAVIKPLYLPLNMKVSFQAIIISLSELHTLYLVYHSLPNITLQGRNF